MAKNETTISLAGVKYLEGMDPIRRPRNGNTPPPRRWQRTHDVPTHQTATRCFCNDSGVDEETTARAKRTRVDAMSFDFEKLDEHIARLRTGDTLTENEVKALCDKVSLAFLTLWSGESPRLGEIELSCLLD